MDRKCWSILARHAIEIYDIIQKIMLDLCFLRHSFVFNIEISFTQEILVTMFRDQRVEEYDNKDWFFVLEDVKDGKRKPVAQEIKLIKRIT